MASRFHIKQGDLLPTLDAIIRDADGVAIPLTTAVSVTFWMRRRGDLETVPKVDDAAGSFVDAAAGHVRYAWLLGDTDAPGTYDAEFRVVWPGDRPQTFPSNGHFAVVIGNRGRAG